MSITPGLRGRARMVVTDADTASAVGSGDVPVLATPRLLALAEAATVDAVTGRLPAGSTSVGVSVTLEHAAASAVGAEVAADAELAEVDGRRLVFAVRVGEGVGEGARSVGTARIERLVVDRDRFLARL
jgi:fluoroacetyl-CoA thioesterase